MSTNKTTNLNLHSWEALDTVRREEFNENFAAIDENAGATWEQVEALAAGKANFACGSYDGTGSYGAGSPTRLRFGFTPKVVLVAGVGGVNQTNTYILLVAPFASSFGGPAEVVAWAEDGVSWYSPTNENVQMNTRNFTYSYAAFG